MADPESPPKSQPSSSNTWIRLLIVFLAPVVISVFMYKLDDFDSAQFPDEGLSLKIMTVPEHYDHILKVTEKIGEGILTRPEDLAYDAESGLIYASCDDGWIKRVTVTDSASEAKVENWAHVGGRPVGLVLGQDGELIVAEAFKGLMRVTKERTISLLTDEAEGLKFKLTNGVDVARNGIIYFTDASYKYNLHQYVLDILEGRPYGRLLSFDPSTNQTQVLIRDLYYANGVALSPKQDFLVYCETIMRRCRKYYVEGDKKGSIEDFASDLPGTPDNIRYDGQGRFWIAIPAAKTFIWDLLMRYPWLRKTIAILGKYITIPIGGKDGGVLAVDLDGKPVALYNDRDLSMVTVGMRIGEHLYYGSIVAPYMSRINVSRLSV